MSADAASADTPPGPPAPEDYDPTTGHHSFGMWALVGVVLLLVAGAAQTWRVAGSLRPPPAPEVVAVRDLVEAAVRVHFRGPRGTGPLAGDARVRFPKLAVDPAPPAGLPPAGWQDRDAAYRPELARGALHRRLVRGEDHASLFVAPRPPELAPEAVTFRRGGLEVRVMPEAGRVVVWVAPEEAPPRS